MKLRIIKEESVFRIQAFIVSHWIFSDGEWAYATKALKVIRLNNDVKKLPMDFKTQKEAEDFIEHFYIIKVVKEYEVE